MQLRRLLTGVLSVGWVERSDSKEVNKSSKPPAPCVPGAIHTGKEIPDPKLRRGSSAGLQPKLNADRWGHALWEGAYHGSAANAVRVARPSRSLTGKP